MAGLTQLDLSRQSLDNSLTLAKVIDNFLDNQDWNISTNNDGTITGLRDGTAARDAVNVQQLNAAIAASLTSYVNYKGGIDASILTGETLDGAKAGDFYFVTTSGNLDGLDFTVGDHLLVAADITDFSVDGSGKIQKVDNTESADILRLNSIVDDLITGGSTSVLSAEQGVVLKGLIDSIQSELDATQAGAGLNADGTYTPDGASNYIGAATSLKNADSLLDAQIKANADAIAGLGAATDVYGEAPTVTDGVAAVAALANTPILAGTARVVLNGARQFEGAGNDYQINETTGVVTFEFPLKSTDCVVVDYKY